MRPFLKWAGNKYRLLKQIQEVLPPGKRLIEPFAGSAAIFLNTEYPQYLIAETNQDLINLYQLLKKEGEPFIDYCRSFFTKENNTEQQYYALRDTFNTTTDIRLKSALFIYLNRHCYNGLCRYNSSYRFNVPFGRYITPFFPEKALNSFHHQAAHAKFKCNDFLTTMKSAKLGDVIYCDPPYIPISGTANFTCYSGQTFTMKQQQQLANQAEKLAAKGIPVIISNHDTPISREIYHHAKLVNFPVKRTISQKTNDRKTVVELLAIYQ